LTQVLIYLCLLHWYYRTSYVLSRLVKTVHRIFAFQGFRARYNNVAETLRKLKFHPEN